MPGTQPFSINDCAAYPYTAGAPGTLVDVVAVKSVEQSLAVDTVDNRGDNAVIATVANLTGIDLTITLGAFTGTSIAAICGGTYSTTGTGGTLVNKLLRNVDDVVPYFKLAAQAYAKDADGGAGRLTYPCVAYQGGPDFALADGAFAEVSVKAKAIPNPQVTGKGDLYQYEAYATYTALS